MKDPAFLFYPGDYLRDTQTLSEKSQVAYDRIMCEHMRNICITQQQLKFFTKRLSDDELDEIMFVLSEVKGGYQIEWVAESINKRKAYSDSRRRNREGKTGKDDDNISETYVTHMEDVNINENIIDIYWDKWKKYKNDEFRFKYKSDVSEEAAKKELLKLSGGDIEMAVKIIDQSIANGWKGLFNLKTDGKAKQPATSERELVELLARKLGNDSPDRD